METCLGGKETVGRDDSKDVLDSVFKGGDLETLKSPEK